MPQQDVLAGMLNSVGFVQSVIVNKRSDASWGRDQGVETMLDGHLRVALALSRDEELGIPVTYVDLLPDEEAAILASFDPISAMAVTDHEKLGALVDEIPEDLRELTAVLRTDRATSRTVTFEAETRLRVVIDCESDVQQRELMKRLMKEGYKCRAE